MPQNHTRQVADTLGVPLLSSEQVAEYLGVPLGTLHQWAYRGVGPTFFKIGRHRRYRPADVDRWIEANPRGGAA